MTFFKQKQKLSILELTILVLMIGALTATAVPQIQNMSSEAKIISAKNSLGSLRTSITIYYATSAINNGYAVYPFLSDWEIYGKVIDKSIPVNPYQLSSNAPDSIIYGLVKGQTHGDRGGFVYNPVTGDIWLNTNIIGENNW